MRTAGRAHTWSANAEVGLQTENVCHNSHIDLLTLLVLRRDQELSAIRVAAINNALNTMLFLGVSSCISKMPDFPLPC